MSIGNLSIFNTQKLYKSCSTDINTSGLAFAASNVTLVTTYKSNASQGCACDLIGGFSLEVLFADGSSDTTYTVGLGAQGGVESDTDFVTENLSDNWIKVTAWPKNYDNFNLANRLITACFTPVCTCGNLTVKDFGIRVIS